MFENKIAGYWTQSYKNLYVFYQMQVAKFVGSYLYICIIIYYYVKSMGAYFKVTYSFIESANARETILNIIFSSSC